MIGFIRRHPVKLALLTVAIVWGVAAHFANKHVDAVCAGTRNVALCQLSLMAGDSDARAQAEGNVQ